MTFDEEKYIREDLPEIPRDLLMNPVKYITRHYESIYPNIGKKVFYLLCLVPGSLIIPPIPRGKKKIKQKINLLFISNSGSGKTSIAEEFEKITYNPIFVEHITTAALNYKLKQEESATLIISDIATAFSNEELVKLIEQVLGEEGSISRETMQTVKKENGRRKIDVVSYLSGTPENINKEIIGHGLLGRTSPLLISHTEKEHEEIIDFVSDEMGKENFLEEKSYIKEFYQELKKIQEGNHEISPIEGYIIPNEIKSEIKRIIKPLVRKSFRAWGVNGVRETEEFFRFLVNSAFINIFKKYEDGKIIGNKLLIDENDFKLAKYLINREIKTKEFIIECLNTINYHNIKTIHQLKKWTEMNNVKSTEAKMLMEGMVKK